MTDDLLSQYDSVEIELGDAADVFARAGEGDEMAQIILDETAERLSILCINICRILDPEFIIIGGGMSLAGDALLDPIKEYFQRRKWTVLNDDVSIVIASNSNDAGIIGAALHAMTCFNRKRDDLAFEMMILNCSPTTSSIIKASKSVEVLNYMHSNRESSSNKNLLDSVNAYHTMGNNLSKDGRATANKNKYDTHLSHSKGNTKVSSSDTDSKAQKAEKSINRKSSSRNQTLVLLASGALSLFSAYTFATSIAGNRIIENDRNNSKTVNLIQYSAFICQICAGTYLLYDSHVHA